MRTTTILALTMLTGCGIYSNGMSAEDELTLRSISGEEEDMAQGFSEPDSQRLPLFRACNADGEYRDLFAEYDADANGDLEVSERRDVFEGSDEMYDRIRAHRWEMLTLIYDGDDTGALGDDERTVLFDDFTIRCENIHERLLADYDLDGNGELDDDELAVLREEHRGMHEERMDEMRDHREEHRGEHKRGEHGERGDRPDYPMFAHEFDTNDDGELSAKELTALRKIMRERIVAGEPLHPDGAKPPLESEE